MMADVPRCVQRSVRVYEMLVKAYPASFRKAYGDEMVRVFGELAADAWRERRGAGVLRVWLRVLGDLLWTVPKEHVIDWKTCEGGAAMRLKSLLTRELLSDEVKRRWGVRLARAYLFGFALAFLVGMISKFASMNITETQLFFGVLLVVAMALQVVGAGLVVQLGAPERSFNLVQIAIHTTAALVMILGVWKLASMAITEYELILGLLLVFQVMMAISAIGGILELIRLNRASRNEQQRT
jgi:hypothetical protein